MGAGLLAFVVMGGGLLGCDGAAQDEGDPLASEAAALELPSGAELHRVTLGGRGSEEHAVPTRIVIEPGDAVEFRTVDHRVHTIKFPTDALSAEGRTFLEDSGKLSSPPLVSRGSRFVVRFEGAPPGVYPFESSGHGGTALGVVEVGLPQSDSTDGGGGA